MPINLRRVLLGGCAAGIIITLSAVAMVPVVGGQMNEALSQRGVPPLGPGAMLFFVCVSLTLGMLLVWLYAAVQPRLAPGPKTAGVVSFVVWLMAYAMANASLVAYGFLPASLSAVGTVWGLAELVVAGQIGARLYKDA